MPVKLTKIFQPVLILLAFLLCNSTVNAQAISTHFFGQNAWMPDTIGASVKGGKLHTKWARVGESGAKMVRFGGIAADRDMPTNYQYIKMIDSIRAKGMEPIIQVPYHDGDYNASQAAQIVQYINITKGKNIKYWSIGNEPDLEYSYTSASQVAAYIRPFASAMKAVDSTIKIIGPETAWYNQSIINGLTTPGGANDITGVDTAGRYYIDIISFHTYPFSGTQTRNQVISKLTASPGFDTYLSTLSARVASCNTAHSRTGTNALKTAVTEMNVNYQNASTDNINGLGVNSFIGGQFVAEMFGIGLKNNVDIMTMWSVVEGNSTALNIGYLDRTTGNKKPVYHHFQMMADHFSGNYINSTSTHTNVKVFSCQNSSLTTVLVMNQDTSSNYSYAVRLDNSVITATNPLKINVSANIAQMYYNIIPNQSSVLLQFNAQGSIVKKVTYTIAQALAGLSPTVSIYTPTIQGLAQPVNSTTPLNLSVCSGNTTSLVATSGTNTIKWYASATSTAVLSTSSVFATPQLTASGTGTVITYYAQANNASTVSAMTPITVTVNPSPLITVNSGSICAGSVFTLVPSGASTYTFSSGISTLSPGANTSYSVTGTSQAGCVSAPAVATVTVHALPQVAVNSGTICSGNVFTIVPSGASSYTFSSGSTTVSPVSNASYSVTGSNAAGCISAPAVASVSVITRPVIAVNSGAICAGNAFTMVPSGATSYSYSSGTSTVIPTSNASYSVTGTNAAGCISASAAIAQVTVIPVPAVLVNSGSLCAGGTFTMIPSGAVSYTFSSGTSTVVPVSNTSYSVSGTDAAGCISTSPAIAQVTVHAVPVLAVNSGSICAGTVFTLTPSGASNYTFSSGSATVSPASAASYTVTGSNSYGCISAPVVANVTVNSPTLTVNSGSICQGGTFTMVPSGASTYTFSGGSAIVSPASGTTFSVLGTDAAGCVSTSYAVASVVVNPNPVITVNSGSICAGSSYTIVPSGAATYTISNSSFVVIPTSNASYTVSGTSLYGCVSTTLANVTVQPLPLVTVSSGTICKGNSFTLTPSGASSYTYSSGSPVVSPNSFNATYTVWGSTAGCLGNAAIAIVTVKPKRACDMGLVAGLVAKPIAAVENTIAVATEGLYELDTATEQTSTAISDEETLTPVITLYPNPNAGEFSIVVDKESILTISSISGAVVHSSNIAAGTTPVNISEMPAGIYVVSVRQGDKVEFVRVVRE